MVREENGSLWENLDNSMLVYSHTNQNGHRFTGKICGRVNNHKIREYFPPRKFCFMWYKMFLDSSSSAIASTTVNTGIKILLKKISVLYKQDLMVYAIWIRYYREWRPGLWNSWSWVSGEVSWDWAHNDKRHLHCTPSASVVSLISIQTIRREGSRKSS